MPINPIPLDGFPRTGRPWNNITPFTYRDGLTYLEVLEALRVWVRDVLTAHINNEMEDFAVDWNQVLNEFQVAVIESFDQKIAEFDADAQSFMDAVDSMFTDLRNSLESDVASQLATVNGALASWDTTYNTFTANIQALVDQWTSTQIENNDVITAAIIANRESATSEKLNATINAATSSVYGARTVFDGDSITIGSQGGTHANGQSQGSAWCAVATRLSNGRIIQLRNVAVTGARSDHQLGRFDANVAPLAPETVVLSVGVNDASQGIDANDVSGFKATWQSSMIEYLDKVRDIGAKLIVGALYPSDDTEKADTFREWNEWLYDWAASENVPVIPFDSAADPITGGWPAGWSTDGIHPEPQTVAVSRLGEIAWDTIEPLFGRPESRRGTYAGDSLLPNGFFTDVIESTVNRPSGVTATAETGTGALSAGEYSYRISSAGLHGETILSDEITATLTAPGQVTLSIPPALNNLGYMVYRRAPGEFTWTFIAQLATSAPSFTDDGLDSTGIPATGEDTSGRFVGLAPGANTAMKHGGGPLTVEGWRGKGFRVAPLFGDTASTNYWSLDLSGVTLGEWYLFTARLRGHDNGFLQVRIDFRDSSNATINTMDMMQDVVPGREQYVAAPFKMRPGTEHMRIYMSSGTVGAVDVGEIWIGGASAVPSVVKS